MESTEAALHRAQLEERAAELERMDAKNTTLEAAIAMVDHRPPVKEWTDEHIKEIAWLEGKQLKKKINAVREGLLEVSGPEGDVLQGLANKEHDRITAALADKVSKQNVSVSDPLADIMCAYEDLRNARVWFRRAPDPEWHGWGRLRGHSVVRVDDLMGADLIVADDDETIALKPKHR